MKINAQIFAILLTRYINFTRKKKKKEETIEEVRKCVPRKKTGSKPFVNSADQNVGSCGWTLLDGSVGNHSMRYRTNCSRGCRLLLHGVNPQQRKNVNEMCTVDRERPFFDDRYAFAVKELR